MAKLEQMLDEYATVRALDPSKVPVVQQQIWTLVQAAQLHHDLHLDQMPGGDDDFDDMVLHVDGYLCEVKDVQIRDGLHVLGGAPLGEARVNLVLAILRATQVWGGRTQALPGLRAALATAYGLDEKALLDDAGAQLSGSALEGARQLGSVIDGPVRSGADAVDLLEQAARRLVLGLETLGWEPGKIAAVIAEVLGDDVPGGTADIVRVLAFGATELVPRLARTTDEIANVLHALDGGFVPAGPSGSPTRGLVNVLPTGRNFYSVDPKAIPSRNAWDTGVALAESLLTRHRADTGDWPRSVGLTVWGTSCMRTQGDDIAEILWLLGCRPVWDDASRRVTGFEIVPAAELARPRVDVTVRISGFFRDALPARGTAAGRRRAGRGRSRRGCGRELRAGPRGGRRRRRGRPPASDSAGVRLQAGCVRGRAAAPGRRSHLAHRCRSGRGVCRLGRLRLWARAGRHRGSRRHGARVHPDPGGGEEPGHPRARHRRQ